MVADSAGFSSGYPSSLVMGDFNTEPEESWVLQQTQRLGWHDLVSWRTATCQVSPEPTTKLNDIGPSASASITSPATLLRAEP